MTATTAATRTAAAAPTTAVTARTRALLASGALAAPLFIVTVVAQEVTRAGFDPKKHPLSLLSTGDLGWIQITNFVVAGLLAFAGAVGLRRVLRPGRAAKWGPILIGAYGIALIWGGVFVADPAFGFPIGTPEGTPPSMTWHGALHGVAPAAASVALLIACVVFARRFAAERRFGWARYSIGTAVVGTVLTIASFPAADYRLMFVGGALIWLWASAVCADRLR
jgi:hypothetical protein